MMRNFQYKYWLIEFDREATVEVYRKIETGDAERCGCCYCRNFIAARDTVYPPNFITFLQDIGIDYRKEGEVFQCYKIRPGLHYYGGWFHFVGKVTDLPTTGENDIKNGTQADFECSVMKRAATPVNKEFNEYLDNGLVAEINFQTNVPWLINEPEHD
jgi:hypothetical protein